MRKILLPVIAAMISICGFCQSNNDNDATLNAFRFTPHYMHPMSYPARDVTPDFFVQLKGDTLDCYLPYIGRAYMAPVDNDGLNFKSLVQDYSQKSATKKKITKRIISFKATKNGVEKFQFSFTIWEDDKADLFLQPSNSQSINYTGEIQNLE